MFQAATWSWFWEANKRLTKEHPDVLKGATFINLEQRQEGQVLALIFNYDHGVYQQEVLADRNNNITIGTVIVLGDWEA